MFFVKKKKRKEEESSRGQACLNKVDFLNCLLFYMQYKYIFS